MTSVVLTILSFFSVVFRSRKNGFSVSAKRGMYFR